MVIKAIDRNHVDVFFHKGWENWARFEVKRVKGKVFPIKISGMALPNDLFKDLVKELENA